MTITINILSALSIVMAFFMPYFILLHLNNKLRKEVEGALNRILELKVYSQITSERLIEFMEVSNINFDSQDKNWERYDKTIELLKEGLSLCSQNLKNVDKNLDIHIENTRDAFRLHNQLHDKTITFMNVVEKRINQKKTLKEILENPIEVKKTACETRLKLKEEVNANDIQTVTEVKNKFDFIISSFNFQRLDIFKKWDDFLYVFRKGKMEESFELKTDLAKAVWNKVIELNEPKPKRKYTKKTIKNEN
jgi:hypothetical protein